MKRKNKKEEGLANPSFALLAKEGGLSELPITTDAGF
jgi:hypothetical protein